MFTSAPQSTRVLKTPGMFIAHLRLRSPGISRPACSNIVSTVCMVHVVSFPDRLGTKPAMYFDLNASTVCSMKGVVHGHANFKRRT